MTRDEAITAIKVVLANRTTTKIDDWLKLPGLGFDLAQTTLEQTPEKPWFLLSEDSYADTTLGDGRVLLPSNFLAEEEEAVLRYVPTDTTQKEVPLVRDDYDQLRSYYAGKTGKPESYSLLGGYFYIFPIPDGIYRLRMIYYKKGIRLTANVENEWLKEAPMLFMGTAGQLVAEGPLRDMKAADIFKSWIQTGGSLLATQNEQRKMSNRSMQIGGPH